MHINLFKRNLY